MYNLEYSPSALQDFIEFAKYISQDLKKEVTTNHFAEILEEAMSIMLEFPHDYAVLALIKPLKHEYRKLFVRKYVLLYRIDEDRHAVIIARVMYANQHYDDIHYPINEGELE